ncbi:hypothetical protein [Ornithinibacillus halophilus]|uniref:Uncharacterized protein n=1 Tax=Ornithinibacillus halophilus TaxID=930117 RepID=A0A1M5I4N9_9BACI|nr:hypothetical protein [Ornithinibacillus halophilus]SHG23235.1 hypothetical protein SAMN05216225_102152 [Ornithinibacillus halophilus]
MKNIKRTIVILLLIILIVTIAWLFIRKTFFPELEAVNMINTYYQSIIDEDYDEAFEQLYLFDYNEPDENANIKAGTNLRKSEAREFYLKKINYLKDKNYRLKDYEIVEVEYADGHSFWHHIELEVEVNGKLYNWHETASIYEGKLMIGEREDQFAKYRDGKMNISLID